MATLRERRTPKDVRHETPPRMGRRPHVRLQLVTTLLLRDLYHGGQITINAIPTIEESVHEIYRRGELAVARRAVYGQWAGRCSNQDEKISEGKSALWSTWKCVTKIT